MSVWDGIVGQRAVIETLERAASDPSKTAQSWLFVGPEGAGRGRLALAFAAALECPDHGDGTCSSCREVIAGTSPDVTVLATDKVAIPIEDVRAFVDSSEQMPSTGPWRVVIVSDIGRMAERATNVLLKEIEEPAPRTIWILCATSLQSVLPTIRSRVRTVRLSLPSDEDVARYLESPAEGRKPVPEAAARRAARLAQGNVDLARRYASTPGAIARRDRLIEGLLRTSSAFEAVVFADKLVEEAQRQAQDAADERVSRAQREFLEQQGYDPDDGRLPKMEPAMRAQYNRLGGGVEKKRLATRLTRDVLDRILDDAESVYRDVEIIHAHAQDAIGLLNLEQRDAVVALAGSITRAEALDRVEAIGAARRRLHGNGMLPLVFEALACRLARVAA